MKHRNQRKRTYRAPLSIPTEVAFEQALLVDTGRLLMYVDELENVNASETTDEADMYFEF